MSIARRFSRRSLPGHRVVLLLLLLLVTACTGLPPPASKPQAFIPLSARTQLGRAATSLPPAVLPDASRFQPLFDAPGALAVRLALIRSAQSSLDLQSYLIGNDAVGNLILSELENAARRGVKVRILVDDFYSAPVEAALERLARQPRIEVRLFNPFTTGRGTTLGRLLNLAFDFRRLNHRMHNKLMVADAAFAITGGRNLADEYFLRSASANFVDVEVLMCGPAIVALEQLFDGYWNSEVVVPLQAIVPSAAPGLSASPGDGLDGAIALAGKEDPAWAPQMSAWLEGSVTVQADAPSKASGIVASRTLSQLAVERLESATTEVNVVSPYFIPGERGIQRLRALHDRGVRVTITTNALADSDEPLVNMVFNRQRLALLRSGAELYEVSDHEMRRDTSLRDKLRASIGRLHAKIALVDREWVLLGSMNLDPRSAWLNTEMGLRIHSAELAQAITRYYGLDAMRGTYRVRLGPEGQVRWIEDGGRGDTQDSEPNLSFWTRLKLRIQSWFVPDDLL